MSLTDGPFLPLLSKLVPYADGSTDATSIIQGYIDQAAARPMTKLRFQDSSGNFQAGSLAPGAGHVWLPPGEFVVSNLVLRHRVTLMGSGFGTVLFQKSGSTGPLITNKHDTSEHAKYWGIRDLQLHGNADGQSQANVGIEMVGDETFNYQSTLDEDWDVHGYVNNVMVIRCKGKGIHTRGSGEHQINNVFVRSCDDIGIHAEGYDSWFSNISIGHSGNQGFKIDGDSNRLNMVKCWYSGRIGASSGQGFHITADRGEMSNCEAQDNTAAGFLFDFAHQWTATALGADSNSRNNPGTYPGFDIYGGGVLQITGTAGNRYNSSGPTNNAAQPQSTALRHRNGSSSLPNDIILTAGMGIWGTANRTSGDSTATGSRVLVNGVALS